MLPQEKSIKVSTRQLKRKREDKDPKEEIEDSAMKEILRTSSGINLNSLDQYLVLGNLTLPRPPPELKERAEQLERDLKDLDNRNMDRKLSNAFYLFVLSDCLQVSGRAP